MLPTKRQKGHYLALLRSWPLLLDGYCTLVFQMPSEVNGVWMVCFWGPVIPPHQVVWNPRGTSSEPFRNCQGDRVLSRTESSVFFKSCCFQLPFIWPRGSMGLEYLPTFAKKNNHPCRKMYQSHGSCGWTSSPLPTVAKKKHQHRCAPSPGGIEEGGHIAPIYKRQTIEGPSVACLQRGNNEKQASKQTNKQTNQNQNQNQSQSQTKPNQQQKTWLNICVCDTHVPFTIKFFIVEGWERTMIHHGTRCYGPGDMDTFKLQVEDMDSKRRWETHVLQTHVWGDAGTIVGQWWPLIPCLTLWFIPYKVSPGWRCGLNRGGRGSIKRQESAPAVCQTISIIAKVQRMSANAQKAPGIESNAVHVTNDAHHCLCKNHRASPADGACNSSDGDVSCVLPHLLVPPELLGCWPCAKLAYCRYEEP